MASNGSVTSTMSSSQLLSSMSTTHSSQISKIYRQASTLFLTRRLPESLSTIMLVISPPAAFDSNGSILSGEPAPIASASKTTRIKVWSLYLTILNAVVELDLDEGKQAFGTQEWRALVAKVREGGIWEEVVTNGYGGVEGDVDSDVVINLATLLLAHARTQSLNQQRLENYIAASSRQNLDVSDRLQSPHRRPHSQCGSSLTKLNGIETSRDLNARVKILELYTLHVLLRNNEWDYAREFISFSEVLDEERREAFLQALQSLQDEQNEVARREREVQRREEEQLQRDNEDARQRRAENEEQERQLQELERGSTKTASSEVSGSNTSPIKARSSKGAPKSSRANGATISHQAKPSIPGKKIGPSPTFIQRAGTVMANVRKLLQTMLASFKGNPMMLLRVLAFLVALLSILGRRDVKERVKRILSQGWDKVRGTVGMGVKVSYI